MASYTIYNTNNSKLYVADTKPDWQSQYKDAFLEQSHDFSQLSLLLPDDCLIVVGPPRRPQWGNETNDSKAERTIGFVRNLSISQQSSVQPLKAVGSRRHIFAKTNQPVSLQMDRMVFTRGTLMGTLYSIVNSGAGNVNKRQTYNAGSIGTLGSIKNGNGMMYTNIEDDLYRIPFGIRIILGSPTVVANNTSQPSILAEACTLQAHSMSFTAGEAVVLEQVSIIADRVVGWDRDENPGASFQD